MLRNAEESAEEAVPASIQSLVLARMDRLLGPDKTALQGASVIGQRFELAALRHLIGEPGYDCGGLVAHHLVRPEGGAYLFAHALIRDGVYSSLLNTRKRALHARAAQWYAEDDPVLHAEHLDRAEDPAAPRAYLDAARALAAGYRYNRALGLIERGLEVAREAIDVCLADRDWDGAERYAGLLEDLVRPEPFVWGSYFAARGRVLAALGRGWRGAEIAAELGRLREIGEGAGFLTSIPGLDAALRAADEADAVPRS